MIKTDNIKAEHKASAAAALTEGAYQNTAYGRRRASRMPFPFGWGVRIAMVAALYIFHRVRRSLAVPSKIPH